MYQRNDIIDPNLVDARGRTNLQRMDKGLAPIGSDGNPVNLHHMLQTNDGSIAEVTQSYNVSLILATFKVTSILKYLGRIVFTGWPGDLKNFKSPGHPVKTISYRTLTMALFGCHKQIKPEAGLV
ncbi:HNH/ENDO VII family nuclease [Dehalobacter sp. TBBPA1]|uniref:HNH/ENDO VII family nuclease n=1 Tax=Dehalobacter sp. TBBPA1 TaxID=3235037 RepID=UPI0034A20091